MPRDQAIRVAISELQAMLDQPRENGRRVWCPDAELEALRRELDTIQRAVGRTKEELAQLQVGDRGREIAGLSGELRAVVGATEAATNRVLGAAERIDGDAARLAAMLADPEQIELLAGLRRQAVTIFESCGFQDLTGQRISAILGTLAFIEERLEQMIATWVGPEAVGAGPVLIDADDSKEADGAGLCRAESRATQAEVDALFD